MEKFKNITDACVGIPKSHIDTDVIIPAARTKTIGQSGLGDGLFYNVRTSKHPDFLALEQFPKRKILVAQENFGCGSSREHAVWALKDWGFRVLIAPSFATIFYNNALKNGLLPLTISAELVEEILGEAHREDYRIEVLLEEQQLLVPNHSPIRFDLKPYYKQCLLEGMSDLDYIRSKMEDIKAYDQRRKEHLFFDTSLLVKN